MLTISKAQIKYLAITDFNLILKAMELNLAPMECRVWHYLNSCAAHEIERGSSAGFPRHEQVSLEVDIFDAIDFLEVELGDFLATAALLEYQNLIPNLETIGGIENV